MDKSERSKAAGAAGIAALISKARQLHAQSEAMIKQAQAECKHPEVSKDRTRRFGDTVLHACPTCGKRWYSDE